MWNSLVLAALATLTPAAAQGPIGPEEAAASHAKMQRQLARIAARADIENPYVGGAVVGALRGQLEGLPVGKKPLPRFKLLLELGFHELRMGENEAAVGHYEEARALVPELAGKLTAADIDKADYDAALAWLRCA